MNTYTITIDGQLRVGIRPCAPDIRGAAHVLVGDVRVPVAGRRGRDDVRPLQKASGDLPLTDDVQGGPGALLLANGATVGGRTVARASDSMRALGLDAGLVEVADGDQVTVTLHTGARVDVACEDGRLYV